MAKTSQMNEPVISFEKISAALEALPAAFVVYDANDRLLICNEAYKRQYHPCEAFVRPGVSHDELQWLKVREGLDARAIGRPDAFVEDERIRHKTGPAVEEWQDDAGRFMRMLRARLPEGMTVAMRFDVSDLREAQLALEEQNEKLEEARQRADHQATVDALTGLTNRRAIGQKLTVLADQCRETGQSLAVLHIDLDGFKQINDNLGHDAGDHVLVEIARRLRGVVRQDDLVARIGGDEFIVALACDENNPTAPHLADRIVREINKPVLYASWHCLVGASVGIAVELPGQLNPSRLLKSADIALYKSKSDGRNRCTLFDDALRRQSELKARIAQDLVSSEMPAQLETHLQPIVTANEQELVSAEALVRWRHPTLGLLSPSQFMPVADELKITSDIDRVVLANVLRLREDWIQQGLYVPTIAVNVSSQRLRDPGLLTELRRLDLPANAIAFEILETVFIDHDTEMLKWNIDGLHDMGIELKIDDYGTAHSSISGLQLIRPKRLKIAGQFVTNILDSEESQEIVRLTVALAHALGIEVTGEGVETSRQAELLEELGCDRLQGYHFGPPMPCHAFVKNLARAPKLAV